MGRRDGGREGREMERETEGKRGKIWGSDTERKSYGGGKIERNI